MKTIWKFLVSFEAPEQLLMLPADAQILSIKNVYEQATMHVQLNTNGKLVARKIYCFGTGHEMPDLNLQYIDTVVFRDGVLIFHFFEERQP